ncbi:MAG: tetratricopeptide repeat protein [Chloroflexaceae bacterium]|jgi:Tfp pilus assembly protein PilF|nr:tetratricopeptide repeat protein [Chloroflexaceae bacterium]
MLAFVSRITGFVAACARNALARFVFGLAAALALAALAGFFIFRPDPRDDLRAADRLFAAGRYHDALNQYALLSAQSGEARPALRLGMVRAVRGEYDLAERALRRAMQLGLNQTDYNMALLYLGHSLLGRNQAALGLDSWRLVEGCGSPPCPYDGVRQLVQAEAALARGEYAVAEGGYERALAQPLPTDWQGLARYRQALLLAARDPTAALRTVQAALPTSPPADPLLAPLLPDTGSDAAQLMTILQAEATQRPQMLGQYYLDRNLFGLAEAQFAQVAPGSSEALAASAYAAYTRWRAGDRQRGLERLEALVQAHPQERRARTLLALAYLSQDDAEAARSQLEALSPADADTHLAWANWYVTQRDYVGAADEYRRALERAAPAERGRYALLVARFHLNTSYEICSFGLPAAEMARRTLPDDADVLTTLAASHYQCGEFAAAAETARAALARSPNAPDASFYLGAALTQLGDQQAARLALVRAADLAPASDWRVRAELALAQMP